MKDEATGYCLAIKTGRHLQHQDVKRVLRELITRYGRPRAIRSDNGSNESFNSTFRMECLNAEVFTCRTEARVMIEKWRCRYNERRPHSSQNYITPEMAYFGLREMRKT